MEKYAFGDIIGHGNYGTCHVVTHLKENRRYVAKRIPVHDVAARGEALAEAQLLSKIKHPNVIAYKESFLSSPDSEEEEAEASSEGRGARRQKSRRDEAPHRGDCLCIVTAYAEEGDLFTHIKRARESNPRRYFPERQVLDWTAQIALALDHIHAMRVMHRDLKTQNIFLGRGGVVKLGDFGISRVLERTDDFATTVAGTPYYLSPEVCQNQPYTLKSDVWSFGCVAYEIATLEHAFAADSLLSLVYRIVNGTCDYSEISQRYDARFCGLVEAMLRRDSAERPSVAAALQSEIMQDHLRRMQRDGLGRPRSAAAPPPKPLIRSKESRMSKEARIAEARIAEASAPADAPAHLHDETPNTPKTAMTPKEAMAERRRKAAEAREAVLVAAATEQTDLSKEAFRREFHGGSVASVATDAGNGDGSSSADDTGGGEMSRDSARFQPDSNDDENPAVASIDRRDGEETFETFEPEDAEIQKFGALSVSGGGGWEDEVAEYALQETGGSFGLRSLEGLEGLEGMEGLEGLEGIPNEVMDSLDGNREPVAVAQFVPPAASVTRFAEGAEGGDAKEDTFAGGFASGVSGEEMCFSPPPGAAVRVPARSAGPGGSRVQFRGAARYDGVSDSSDAGSALGGSLARSAYSDRAPDRTARAELTGDARDSLEKALAPVDKNAGEPEAVPDASWLNSTLPDAPLSPAQTDMEMDVLAALTLDAEADVRAEEEASLVSAFAARHTSAGARGGADGVSAGVSVAAYDHHDAPRIARDADAERAVLLEAAKSLDKEDADAMRAAAAEAERRAPPRAEPEAASSARDASTTSDTRDLPTREPPLPNPPADDSVVAARAHKVSRLRAMCGAQLGAAFADVHAFLRSARRRRADDAEVKRRLMRLVRGDAAKLAACFAVDMLCFEEEHLFSELEQVRAPGTYAPGVNVFVDDGKDVPETQKRNAKKTDGRSDGGGAERLGNAAGNAGSSTASSRSQSPRMSSPHTALPGGGLERRAFKATAAEREKARKRISLPGA